MFVSGYYLAGLLKNMDDMDGAKLYLEVIGGETEQLGASTSTTSPAS